MRLITRNGYDLAARFPLAAAAVGALPARSCLVDGEAVAVDVRRLIQWLRLLMLRILIVARFPTQLKSA